MSRSTLVVVELVNNFLIEACAVQPEILKDPTVDFEQLGLDSLDLAEIVYEVEDKFGIVVKDAGRLHRMSLGETYAFFQKLVDMKGIKPAAPAPAALEVRALPGKLGIAVN